MQDLNTMDDLNELKASLKPEAFIIYLQQLNDAQIKKLIFRADIFDSTPRHQWDDFKMIVRWGNFSLNRVLQFMHGFTFHEIARMFYDAPNEDIHYYFNYLCSMENVALFTEAVSQLPKELPYAETAIPVWNQRWYEGHMGGFDRMLEGLDPDKKTAFFNTPQVTRFVQTFGLGNKEHWSREHTLDLISRRWKIQRLALINYILALWSLPLITPEEKAAYHLQSEEECNLPLSEDKKANKKAVDKIIYLGYWGFIAPNLRGEDYVWKLCYSINESFPQVSTWVDPSNSFSELLELLQPEERTLVFDTIHNDIVRLMQRAYSLPKILKHFTPAQCAALCTLSKHQLKNRDIIHELAWTLRELNIDQGRAICTALFPDVLQSLGNILHIYENLSYEVPKQEMFYQAVKPYMSTFLQAEAEKDYAIETLWYLPNSWHEERSEFIKNISNHVKSTDIFSQILRRLQMEERPIFYVAIKARLLDLVNTPHDVSPLIHGLAYCSIEECIAFCVQAKDKLSPYLQSSSDFESLFSYFSLENRAIIRQKMAPAFPAIILSIQEFGEIFHMQKDPILSDDMKKCLPKLFKTAQDVHVLFDQLKNVDKITAVYDAFYEPLRQLILTTNDPGLILQHLSAVQCTSLLTDLFPKHTDFSQEYISQLVDRLDDEPLHAVCKAIKPQLKKHGFSMHYLIALLAAIADKRKQSIVYQVMTDHSSLQVENISVSERLATLDAKVQISGSTHCFTNFFVTEISGYKQFRLNPLRMEFLLAWDAEDSNALKTAFDKLACCANTHRSYFFNNGPTHSCTQLVQSLVDMCALNASAMDKLNLALGFNIDPQAPAQPMMEQALLRYINALKAPAMESEINQMTFSASR